MDFIQDIKQSFTKGNYLNQLIYINLGLFLLVTLVSVFGFLFKLEISNNILVDSLSLPAHRQDLLHHPWSLITYMFIHKSFIHILFNMLWLYWFGKIFLQYFEQKHFLSVYISGGIAGALLFILSYNTFPIFASTREIASAIGASAAVYAIVFSVSTYVPNVEIRFAFLGNIKLKYIALGLITLDLVTIPSINAGGHIAHLGGALFGFAFAYQYKKGKLITKSIEHILNIIFTFLKPKPKMKITYKKTGNVDYDYQNKKATQQKKIDTILEKISKSGYSSLSNEEKELLFKMSNKK